jgi:hypothetical protein
MNEELSERDIATALLESAFRGTATTISVAQAQKLTGICLAAASTIWYETVTPPGNRREWPAE